MPIYRSLGWELAGGEDEFTVPARSLRGLVDAGQGGRGARERATRTSPSAGPALPTPPTVIDVIGRAHQRRPRRGPLTWDEGPAAQWLGRNDLYSYLAGDDGFAAYRWARR